MHSFQLATAILASFGLALSPAEIDFECQETVIDDTKTDNMLMCRLKEVPATPVNVHFESRFLNFAACVLTLADAEWHPIAVTVVPVCSRKETIPIAISARLYSSDCFESNKEITVQRSFDSCIYGSSVGDPHFLTFNGQAYDFQGQGYYDLFNHPQFQVQVVQGAYNSNGAAVNNAVSIRYGNSIMALDLRTDSLMKQVTENVDGIVYTPPSATDTTHTVLLPCGSKVVFTTYGDYMNIDLFVAACYSGYGGLLNQAGLATGEYFAREGVTTDVMTFAQSWVVPETDINMNGKFVPFTSPAMAVLKCALPTSCAAPTIAAPVQTIDLPVYVAPPPQTTTVVTTVVAQPTITTAGEITTAAAIPAITTIGTTAGVTTTTILTTVTVAPGYTIQAPTPEYIQEATTLCHGMFVVDGCNEILPPARHVQACISDSTILGNYAMAESNRIQYMAKCKTLLGYMTADPDEQVVVKADEIKEEYGLGDNKCVLDCSGRGTCTANGCVCNAGFSGLGCVTDLAPLLSYNSEQNAYVTHNPIPVVAPATSADKPVTDSAPSDKPVTDSAPASNLSPATSPKVYSNAPASIAPVAETDAELPIYNSAKTSTIGLSLVGGLMLML
jgi:von Willebrand factor type D domain